MLTARRDPLLHPGAPGIAQAGHPGHTAHSPGFTRFMNFLQVAGSLLAIPLGLASGYSIYHANFSAEASCQGLRANIISMLDKSADASTLRMLMRRDVADFETACGTVDPDAVKAFKTLLASGRKAAPAPEPVKQVAHEPVPHAKEIAKRAEVKAPHAATEAKRVRRDAAESDARWVASVREALIHTPEAEAEVAKAPAALPARPRKAARERSPAPVAPRVTQQAPVSLAPPAAPRDAAPALPPAAAVATAPAPKRASDHPVPPASIPDAAPPAPVAAVAEKHSGFRDAIAGIPLLGHIVGR